MKYIVIPKEIKLNEIFANGFSFSPWKYKRVEIKNSNCVFVRDLLDRELKPSDKGMEVGSRSYITKSSYFFIRTKSLQRNSFLPSFTPESVIPVLPASFKPFNLEAGSLLISKDSNIGEVVILDRDYPNHMISGGIYKLPISQHKYYLFAFLKNDFFRMQLNLLASKGVTIRHAKKLFLDCKIPFPNQKNANQVIKYVEVLVQSIIKKEKEIARKNELTFELIEKELLGNQKANNFIYEYPNSNEISSQLRIDAGYYCENLKQKQFIIQNYIYGAKHIKAWNFEIKRGQNLQVSCIGKSIYSDDPKDNFYTLIRPTSFSEYGTVAKYEYLGNPKQLSILEPGDIVFSAEGTIGKCVLFVNPGEKYITNIHGVVLNKKDHNIDESAFISCFLRFLRCWRFLDYISVGGQGGSLAMKYWEDVLIPNFEISKQKEIANLYHKPVNLNFVANSNLEQFIRNDSKWYQQAGVIQIDDLAKKIRKRLDEVVYQITMNEKVDIDFSFLNN